MLNKNISLTSKEEEKLKQNLQDLLRDKRKFVNRYGKDAEKIMYGIAIKRSKMKKKDTKLQEIIKKVLIKENFQLKERKILIKKLF
jgi:hypothetical protein